MITDLKVLKAAHELSKSKDKTDSIYSVYGRLYPGELIESEDYASLYRKKNELIREQKLVAKANIFPVLYVTVEGSHYIAECDYEDRMAKAD